MKTAEAEFNKAMTALHLEVDESIANDIRQKAENYVESLIEENERLSILLDAAKEALKE